MSDLIKKAINSLYLDYEIEYAVINLEDENLINRQRQFFDFLEKRKQQNFISILEGEDIQKRVYPQNIMQSAKSMIVLLFPYLSTEHEFDCNLSVYCMGLDYHISVSENVNNIVEYIQNSYKDAGFYTQVDTGPLNERFFAFYSGIGILGMNSMIFSRIYGSYVNIAIILTDIKLEEKLYKIQYCDNCRQCIRHCPGNAIKEGYVIDTQKCISYITQLKGELEHSSKKKLKSTNKVFGCDKCQSVCHMNKDIKKIQSSYSIIKNLYIDDIKDISNKKFKQKYRDRAFSFRGKSVIQRNLEILGENLE